MSQMRTFQRIEKHSPAKLILLFKSLILLSFFSSCIDVGLTQSASTTRTKSNTGGTSTNTENTKDIPDEPTFEAGVNYLQEGSRESTGILDIQGDSTDFFYLRGTGVHDYAKNYPSTVQCMAFRINTSGVNYTQLLLAATPSSFNNFATGEKEYYYTLSLQDKDRNQSFCLKVGLLSVISASYPTDSMAYQVSDICPACTSTSFTSGLTKIYTEGGSTINNVTVSHLALRIAMSTTNVPVGSACTVNSQCEAIGLDCCLSNQCVKDKSIKSGVDQTSSRFLQSVTDITISPSAIFNFSDLYNLCSTHVIPDEPDVEDPAPPSDEFTPRFAELTELYNCLTPIEGEMGLCTKTYDLAAREYTTLNNQGTEATNDDVYTFNTGLDDLTFQTVVPTLANTDSLYKVTYGGVTLYDLPNSINNTTAITAIANGNDDLTTATQITLAPESAYQLPASASDKKMKLTFKVDASCKKVNSSLAKCTKYYIQGANEGKVTDHPTTTDPFILPNYSDVTRPLQVRVDDELKIEGTHYTVDRASTPPTISFIAGKEVFSLQEVQIEYYADLTNAATNILQTVSDARDRVRSMCKCTGEECSLLPIKDESDTIVNFECFYPEDTTPAPLQQTFYLNSKTIPVRYYDGTNGVYFKDTKVVQGVPAQEGNEFKYHDKSDMLTPNNFTNLSLPAAYQAGSYIGFNEIYGSIDPLDPDSPKPAKEVRVDVGKTYDIFTDFGQTSSCYKCGKDYWLSGKYLFPDNLLNKGGGILPDLFATNKSSKNILQPADDRIFGRACYLPATMIPWTHASNASTQTQRLSRMEAQHFLFANGYQKDWFGFDYGSIIGSFDGIKWFSVGNQRRIKAKSNKLFLAVNSYYADLTNPSTYTMTVSLATNVPDAGSSVQSDFESDGAMCQKSHVCDQDSDCAAKLGWDYVCESVTSMKTIWPKYDNNASEIPNDQFDEMSIYSLLSPITGGSKRCVYRGKGAPCEYENITNPNGDETYNRTTKKKLLNCAPNYYCQAISDGGNNDNAFFNTKIARFARSPSEQNISSRLADVDNDGTTDPDLPEFGFGARILGRPLEYNGTETITASAKTNLFSVSTAAINNKVKGICLPGKDASDGNLSVDSQNVTRPTDTDLLGDQFSGQGMTYEGNSANSRYLSSCGVFDSEGDYFHSKVSTIGTSTDDASIANLARSQALPSNSLKVFRDNPLLGIENLIVDYATTTPMKAILQENRCLRAPGATCFTNQDCGPNQIVEKALRSVDPDDASLTGVLNKYELSFWKEELICSQKEKKGTADYDHGNNRCCREIGKVMKVGNYYQDNPIIEPTGVPGVDTDLDDPTRNSRNSTIAAELNAATPTLNELSAAVADTERVIGTGAGQVDLQKQWKTIDTLAKRTCCSENWVRMFASGNRVDKAPNTNYAFSPNKFQDIDKGNFRCFNWVQDANDDGDEFDCSESGNPNDPRCDVRNWLNSEAEPILEVLGLLELTGIPQIAIPAADETDGGTYTDLHCKVDPVLKTNPGTGKFPPNIFATYAAGTTEYSRASTVYGNTDPKYYSAADESNFASGGKIKKVFSEDEYRCCIPAGEIVGDDVSSEQCCTGLKVGNRCQLPSFTNVSVYLNRYISSEANDKSENLFDSETGFINSPTTVEQIACQKKLCASNILVRGVVLSPVMIEGVDAEYQSVRVNQFIDSDDFEDNFDGFSDYYNAGVKWNNHVYCGSQSILDRVGTPGFSIVQCPN